MAKYKKKPVIIEAEIYNFGLEDGFTRWNEYVPADSNKYPENMRSEKYPRYINIYENFIDEALTDIDTYWKPYINTLEGMMTISKGDYIITGIKGERYPCKPDIFEATYELVGN